VKLLGVPNLDEIKTLRGHTDRIGGISWFPGATIEGSGVSPDAANLVSGGAEGNVHLWSLNQDTPLATLQGPLKSRVCRVEVHPSGRYVAAASEDTTWRLWDVNTTTELLLQEGHSRGVFCVAFDGSGALIATGGTDSYGRVVDLRSGRTIMILDGHIKPIYGIDWIGGGHRILTGSADGWIKCWDLRKVQNVGGVGAHKSVVSDLRVFKGIDNPVNGHPPVFDENGNRMPKKSGTFFVSSGFDKEVKLFSNDDWSLIQSLSGHSGNVHSVDISENSKWIVSGAYDRTVKLWGRNDGEGI